MVPLAIHPVRDQEKHFDLVDPARSPRLVTRLRDEAALIRPVAVGLACCIALALVAGRATQLPGTTSPSTWWGMLEPNGSRGPSPAIGIIEIGAVALLVWSWWQLLRQPSRLSGSRVSAIAALWAIPLTIGPVILSLDAYSYLAQGRLAQLGLDPFRHAPAALGSSAWLAGVDPFWRQSRSPYGPLTVLLQRLLADTGSVVGALVALHLFVLVCLAIAVAVVFRLTSAADRPRVLLLTLVNPLVLLQLLGAAHWESLLVVLVAAGLLAWQRQHPLLAIGLVSAAAAVKAPAGFAVAVLVTLYVLAATPDRRVRAVAAAATVLSLPWLALALVVPNSLGFLEAFGTPLTGRTLWAPTTLLAEVLDPALELVGVRAPFDAILGACRAGGLLLGASICCALLVTARRRPAGTTIGLGLIAVALLGPVLYPWYLAWGLLPLAIGPVRYRRALVALISASVFAGLPGTRPLGMALLRLAADAPALAALVAAVVVIAVAVGVRQVHLLGPELTPRVDSQPSAAPADPSRERQPRHTGPMPHLPHSPHLPHLPHLTHSPVRALCSACTVVADLHIERSPLGREDVANA